jgi:hypothetical protein
MSYAATIPNRRSVQDAWDKYQALCLVVASDPILAADPIQQLAMKRAHERWAQAFSRSSSSASARIANSFSAPPSGVGQ